MKKKVAIPLVVALIGTGIYVLGAAWASQSGYYNSDPAKRDANIGAGLIAFVGIGIGAAGLLWLAVAVVKSIILRSKSP